MVINVAIVNQSTHVADSDLTLYALALQGQCVYHFCPSWHVATAHVVAVPRGGAVPAGAWVIYIQDTVPVSGALGYHDVTSAEVPLAYVAAVTTAQAGVSLSSVISHELLEMLGDPLIQSAVQVDTYHIYAYEACDAVEQSSYIIKRTNPATGVLQDVEVSNFVTPQWFTGGPGPYDHLHKLTAAKQLLPGGSYIGVGTASSTGIHWTQKNADGTETAASDPDDGARAFPQYCNRPQIRAQRALDEVTPAS